MTKVLANDGIAENGLEMLQSAGFEVITEKVEQDQLANEINSQGIEVLLVRSATKVREDLIDQVPNLKMIGRGGVGMDNIDVEYAESKGIKVFNTPASSSSSVAELAIAHMFALSRFVHNANREMPSKGVSEFKALKKAYSKGFELDGKTLGIIGFGRIGQETARRAIGLGMKVVAHNLHDMSGEVKIKLHDAHGNDITCYAEMKSKEEVLKEADILTLHVPGGGSALIGEAELDLMKNGSYLINTARGGVVDEEALLKALDSGKLSGAALDVFINEPTPDERLLNHDKISVTPHIGASTNEAQTRIGAELASIIIEHYK